MFGVDFSPGEAAMRRMIASVESLIYPRNSRCNVSYSVLRHDMVLRHHGNACVAFGGR